MTFIMRLLTLCLFITLVSCSYISQSSLLNKGNREYLSAKSIPPLRTPPGIASSTIQSYYPVSYRNYPPSALDVNLKPPGLMDR